MTTKHERGLNGFDCEHFRWCGKLPVALRVSSIPRIALVAIISEPAIVAIPRHTANPVLKSAPTWPISRSPERASVLTRNMRLQL